MQRVAQKQTNVNPIMVRLATICPVVSLLLPLALLFGLAHRSAGQDSGRDEAQEDVPMLGELMGEAVTLVRQNSFDAALVVLRRAASLYPEERDPQFAIVQVLNQAALAADDRENASEYFFQASRASKQFLKQFDELPEPAKKLLVTSIYKSAASLALANRTDAALAELEAAFAAGFDDLEMVESDDELKELRGDARFANTIASCRQLVAAQQQARIEQLRVELKHELAEFESFDFDFELQTVEGATVKLADYSEKMLIVDFWGTWCAPCIKEIPHFNRLQKEFKQQLAIVGIANEMRDDPAEAKERITKFLAKRDVDYTIVLSTQDVLDQVEINSYPTTLFIDTAGRVRFKADGYHDYQKLRLIIELLMDK